MYFELTPILDKMETLYQLPRTKQRFEAYLLLLQGEKKQDMILPIAGYNPMGKEIVLEKIKMLRQLQAEALIPSALEQINRTLPAGNREKMEVVINVADDVGGSWSSRYTTDYINRFDVGPLVKRNFCTPYFWTSETYSTALILQRAKAAVYRTLYWKKKGKPMTLAACVAQEVYVQQQLDSSIPTVQEYDFDAIGTFFKQYAESEDYSLLFNFFYGDEASEQLAYPVYGIHKMGGLAYVQYLAESSSIQHPI